MMSSHLNISNCQPFLPLTQVPTYLLQGVVQAIPGGNSMRREAISVHHQPWVIQPRCQCATGASQAGRANASSISIATATALAHPAPPATAANSGGAANGPSDLRQGTGSCRHICCQDEHTGRHVGLESCQVKWCGACVDRHSRVQAVIRGCWAEAAAGGDKRVHGLQL